MTNIKQIGAVFSQETVIDPLKRQRASDEASLSLGSVKEDVRLLPRTNAVKRLRSITFMLYELDDKGNEVGILQTHTLLIAPQGYQQSEPNRSTVIQTLGGAFIDDWGLGLKQINITGTTGYAKRLVHESAGTANTAGIDRAMLATDGYHAFKDLRDNVYRQYFDLDQKSIVGSTDMSGVLDRNSAIAAGQKRAGDPVFADQQDARKEVVGAAWDMITDVASTVGGSFNRNNPKDGGAKGMTKSERQSLIRLKMFFWSNEDYYVVHPLDFSFSQSADEPLIYRYSLFFIVMEDLSDAEANSDLRRMAEHDPFVNLTDARYRSVLINEQLEGALLYQIVWKNYKEMGQFGGFMSASSSFQTPQMPGSFQARPLQNLKREPTVTASYYDLDAKDVLRSGDPYLTSGDLGQIGIRDWEGRNILGLLGKDEYAKGSPNYGRKATKDLKVKSYSGSLRNVVVSKSLDEALLRGITPTRSEVEGVFDSIAAVEQGKASPSSIPGDGDPAKKKDFFKFMDNVIESVSDTHSWVDNFVNGRDNILPAINKFQGQLDKFIELENELLLLPSAFIPYDLIHSIRQVECDIGALLSFPELFEQSVESAINEFRALLEGSGCSQTL